MMLLRPDATLRHADWTKRTQDVMTPRVTREDAVALMFALSDRQYERDDKGQFAETGTASFKSGAKVYSVGLHGPVEYTVKAVVNAGKDKGKIKLIGSYGSTINLPPSSLHHTEASAVAEASASKSKSDSELAGKPKAPTFTGRRRLKDFDDEKVADIPVFHSTEIDMSKDASEWADSLVGIKRAAVDSWTRGGKGANVNTLVQQEKDGIDSSKLRAFHEALASAPTYEGIAYRGMSLANDSEVLDNLKVGATWTQKAAHSMSTDPSVAGLFTALGVKNVKDKTSVMMRVKVKTAKYIAPASKAVSEREMIGQRNTKYRIISVKRDQWVLFASAKSWQHELLLDEPMQTHHYHYVIDVEEV